MPPSPRSGMTDSSGARETWSDADGGLRAGPAQQNGLRIGNLGMQCPITRRSMDGRSYAAVLVSSNKETGCCASCAGDFVNDTLWDILGTKNPLEAAFATKEASVSPPRPLRDQLPTSFGTGLSWDVVGTGASPRCHDKEEKGIYHEDRAGSGPRDATAAPL